MLQPSPTYSSGEFHRNRTTNRSHPSCSRLRNKWDSTKLLPGPTCNTYPGSLAGGWGMGDGEGLSPGCMSNRRFQVGSEGLVHTASEGQEPCKEPYSASRRPYVAFLGLGETCTRAITCRACGCPPGAEERKGCFLTRKYYFFRTD